MKHTVREALIFKYISTPDGLDAMAKSMTQPLRTRLDYMEPHPDNTINNLTKLNKDRSEVSKYIMNYIKTYKECRYLRSAIQQSHPEYENILDKLLVLK